MSTNTLKQALEIVYGDIKNINKRVVNLETASAGVLYTETTKSAVAYQDNVSANACPYALLNKIGSMSHKRENLANNPTITNNVSSDFNPIIALENLNLKANTTYTISFKNINTLNSGTRYYITTDPNISYIYIGANSSKTDYSLTFTTTATTTKLYVRLQYTSGGDTGTTTNVTLNEGSTALPYQPYFEGIRDSAVTSVISKDSNDTVLQTINIPDEVQALEGYGWGINSSVYNYIDLVNKKFIQNVNRVKLKDLSWGLSASNNFYCFINTMNTSLAINQICLCSNYTYDTTNSAIDKTYWNASGTIFIRDLSYENITTFTNHFTDDDYLYYELATPIETDISQYIDDNSIQIEPNGTITFDSTYQQAIPYEYLYLEKVGANNE